MTERPLTSAQLTRREPGIAPVQLDLTRKAPPSGDGRAAPHADTLSRNLSVNTYFRNMATEHRPAHRFAGTTRRDWQRWREALLPAVLGTLGNPCADVPLNPQVIAEWQEDGLIKQKVVFDVDRGLSASAYVFRPPSDRPLPAILCCHGHGPLGKDAVMGIRAPDRAAHAAGHHNDYGLQMARAGFVTIAIDWRGFGERDDRRKPNHNDIFGTRDICNVHYIRASIMGMTVLGMDIHDGRKALDYLCQQDFVDAGRIGVMGLSFGGTMATWMSIADERIRAADVICYSDRFAEFGMRFANFCGSQITPGLFQLCDVPDLQGLIAPRPLLVEIGSYDDCFLLEAAMSCYHDVEKIYTAAGVRNRLVLDLFDGGHVWSGRKSAAFFNENL